MKHERLALALKNVCFFAVCQLASSSGAFYNARKFVVVGKCIEQDNSRYCRRFRLNNNEGGEGKVVKITCNYRGNKR